jgi:hypothetical protein
MQAEAELRRRALNDLTSQYVAAERRMTATARRESAERVKVAREGERRYRSAIGVGLGGARSFASGALSTGREIQGEMQSARARRATTEHTLNSALYQAHIYGSEGGDAQARVMQFAASRGMDPQAVAEELPRLKVASRCSLVQAPPSVARTLSSNCRSRSSHRAPTRAPRR